MVARLPRPVWIWLILVIATMLSFESSFSNSIGERVATALVLLVAVVKVRFVALEFMNLRNAPLYFRVGIEIWLVALYGIMLCLYLSSS